jgi:hypothetical protein
MHRDVRLDLDSDALVAAGCAVVDADDPWRAVELYLENGWTDGLPVIPPTEDAVSAMLARSHRAPGEILGEVPQRDKQMTCLQAAICAVMAGAKPEYFPVILATWDVVLDPRFNANGVMSSSGGPGLTAVVSGAYGRAIGMNSGTGLLGPGNRANATIGRAVRLGAILALGARLGVLDASSFSHGGKYTSHFLEDDPAPPWEPLRVREGFAQADTTVTVIAADAPRQLQQSTNGDPAAVLKTFAACMSDPSHRGAGNNTYYLIVLGPEHADVLRSAGLSPQAIAEHLSEATRLTKADFARAGILVEEDNLLERAADADGRFTTAAPDHICVTTAGGAGAGWSVVIPCWAPGFATETLTKPVVLLERA